MTESIETEASLIELARKGDKDAFEVLFGKYERLIYFIANQYYLPGSDKDDVFQEACIGFLVAIDNFERKKSENFAAFAGMCVHRQIKNAVKIANAKKHGPLNTGIYFSSPFCYQNDGIRSVEDAMQSKTFQPEEWVIAKEFNEWVKTKLSFFELKCALLRIERYSYEEIAGKLNCQKRSASNALQRVKRKIEAKIKEEAQ